MKLFIQITVIFLSSVVFAQELDGPSQEALDKTKALLRDPNQRQEVIDGNDKARRADEMVRRIGTSEDQQKIYDLAADVFDSLVKQANGDPAKIQELLKQSPESFAGSMTAEQQKKLQDLVQGLQINSTESPAPQ